MKKRAILTILSLILTAVMLFTNMLPGFVTHVAAAVNTMVTVKIDWDDNGDTSGRQPITVNLRANVELFGDTNVTEMTNFKAQGKVELNANNGWSYTWSGLPTTYSGLDIYGYSVNLASDSNIDGYEAPVPSTNGNTWIFTYTKIPTDPDPEPEETSVTVKIDWDDVNNLDGIRPSELVVTLVRHYKDDSGLMPDVKVDRVFNEYNGWQYTWEHLPLVEGDDPAYAVELSYYVELSVPSIDGYDIRSGVKTDDNGDVWTFTITHEPTTNIPVKVVWLNDNDNADLTRSDVRVALYVDNSWLDNNAKYDEVTLNAANGWQYEWTPPTHMRLPSTTYVKNTYYVVLETESVPGYEFISILKEDGIYTIKYTREEQEPPKTDVTVSIEWENDDESSRPKEVEVALYKGLGTKNPEKVMLKADEGWTYTWSDLLELDGTHLITYFVDQTKVDGYRWYTSKFERVSSDESNDGKGKVEIVLTNTKIEEISVPVSVEWIDLNGKVLGIERPTKLEVRLYRGTGYTPNFDPTKGGTELVNEELVYNGGAFLTNDGGWKHTWNGLPKYNDSGIEYIYTVREIVPDHYSVDLVNDNGVFKLINKACDLTNLSIEKVWNDGDDQDGLRPDSIFVDLYVRVNDKAEWEFVEALEITAENGWKLTVENKPYYPGVEYKIEERPVDEYTTESVKFGTLADGDFGYKITNSYTPKVTTISVNKLWDDDDSEGMRPEEIEVTLIGTIVVDGEEEEVVSKTVTISYDEETDSWSHTWEDLPVYHKGEEITYAVKETEVTYYDAEVKDNGNGTFTITNTYVPGLTDISVEKVWDDDNDSAGMRPEEIEVTLTGVIEIDGKTENVVSKTAKIRETNGKWECGWKDLPVYLKGEKVTYTVAESPIDYYDADVKDNGDGTFTITNTYEPELTDISVEKLWDDDDDSAGMRPKEIEVTLTGVITIDGKTEKVVSKTAKISETNGKWTCEWKDLSVYLKGEKIVYTVEESEVKYYSADVVDNKDGTFTITNTYVAPEPEPEPPKPNIPQIPPIPPYPPEPEEIPLPEEGTAFGGEYALENVEDANSSASLDVLLSLMALSFIGAAVAVTALRKNKR